MFECILVRTKFRLHTIGGLEITTLQAEKMKEVEKLVGAFYNVPGNPWIFEEAIVGIEDTNGQKPAGFIFLLYHANKVSSLPFSGFRHRGRCLCRQLQNFVNTKPLPRARSCRKIQT